MHTLMKVARASALGKKLPCKSMFYIFVIFAGKKEKDIPIKLLTVVTSGDESTE